MPMLTHNTKNTIELKNDKNSEPPVQYKLYNCRLPADFTCRIRATEANYLIMKTFTDKIPHNFCPPIHIIHCTTPTAPSMAVYRYAHTWCNQRFTKIAKLCAIVGKNRSWYRWL